MVSMRKVYSPLRLALAVLAVAAAAVALRPLALAAAAQAAAAQAVAVAAEPGPTIAVSEDTPEEVVTATERVGKVNSGMDRIQGMDLEDLVEMAAPSALPAGTARFIAGL